MDLPLDKLLPGCIALLGLPDDENSSYVRGSAEAPEAIRMALHCESSNLSTEDGGDLGDEVLFIDLGDLKHLAETPYRLRIETAITAALVRGASVLSLGGDHAVSYPALRAYAGHFGPLDVIHLDAHPDLYDELDPAYAPGVSHHEPGGLSTREVLRLIHNLPVRPVGADLVELNPTRDTSGMSSMVAAKIVKELAAAMLHV